MKSNAKNQMSSKQKPFIFKILFSIKKSTGLCVGTYFSSPCMFISGQAPAPMFFGTIALSWHSCPMAKEGQRLLLKHAQRMPNFLEVERVFSSGNGHLSLSQRTEVTD